MLFYLLGSLPLPLPLAVTPTEQGPGRLVGLRLVRMSPYLLAGVFRWLLQPSVHSRVPVEATRSTFFLLANFWMAAFRVSLLASRYSRLI